MVTLTKEQSQLEVELLPGDINELKIDGNHTNLHSNRAFSKWETGEQMGTANMRLVALNAGSYQEIPQTNQLSMREALLLTRRKLLQQPTSSGERSLAREIIAESNRSRLRMSETELSGVKLSGNNLESADLSDTDLREAILSGTIQPKRRIFPTKFSLGLKSLQRLLKS